MGADAERIRFSDLTPDLYNSYVKFARRHYGWASYQASPDYLAWLYDLHPNGEVPRAIVGVSANNEVRAAIHILSIDGSDQRVAALHNLMVDDDLRTGLGFLLLRKAISGADLTVVPGVTGPFAEIYGLLNSVRTPVVWKRKDSLTLAALRRAPQWSHFAIGSNSLSRHLAGLHGRHPTPGFRICTVPTNADLEQLAGSLQELNPEVSWSCDLLRWRPSTASRRSSSCTTKPYFRSYTSGGSK